MTKSIVLGATAAFLALAAPIHASQDSPDQTTEADDISSTEEVICRREPPPPGSRIGGRNVCRTAMEWSQIERETDNFMEHMYQRSKTQDNCTALNPC